MRGRRARLSAHLAVAVEDGAPVLPAAVLWGLGLGEGDLLAVVEARRTLISWQTAGVLLAMLSVLATLTWTALVLANDEG